MLNGAETVTAIYLLARLIAGEAGELCGIEGKLAVAHVWANRQAAGIEGGWYGYAEPTALDVQVAEMFWRWADPTDGAIFLVSGQDAERVTVRAMLAGRERTRRIECAGGLALEAWR